MLRVREAAVKLSKPALDVLRKLDREGACPTTTSTMGRYVAGTVVAVWSGQSRQRQDATSGCTA